MSALPEPSVALVVLAGGRSRRMGFRKEFLTTVRGPLLERSVSAVRRGSPIPVVEAWLAGSTRETPPTHQALRRVSDACFGRGPLAGVAAGLRAIRSPWAWVIGCDGVPLSPTLLSRLWELANADECRAVVPESRSGVQPLPGLYHRSVWRVAEARLRARQLRLVDLLGELDVRVLPWGEEDRPDGVAAFPWDLDFPADRARVERRLPPRRT